MKTTPQPIPALTVGISRREVGGYTVELHYELPDSPSGIAQARGPAVFDFARSRETVLDPQAYGQHLAATLFADSRIKSYFDKAWVSAQQDGGRMRLILQIEPDAPELHNLRWETLCHPESGEFMVPDANLPFSRFLDSTNWTRILLKPKGKLHALVAVANPTELQEGKRLGGQVLAPLNVSAELERAHQGLIVIGRVDELASSPDRPGQVTLSNLFDRLRQGYDILYLVCHGALLPDDPDDPNSLFKPYLVLEQPDGRVDRVDGNWLVEKIRGLDARKRPRLIVLASCQSGGLGQVPDPKQVESTDRGALAALGPRLAEAGVPAVIAMQDNVKMETVEGFMPVFFEELARDGQLDRAMALARSAVLRTRHDWWVPVLYTRLKDGRLFAKNLPIPLLLVLLILALMITLGGFGWYKTQPIPMSTGFNIAIAEFAVQDESGHLRSTPQGLAVSQGLFSTIDNSLKQLPPSIQFDRRGPEDVGIIRGEDLTARKDRAERIAQRWNASVLVYGIITPVDGGYQIELYFYIADQEFRYGEEVTGHNRLGKPLPVDLNLEPEKIVLLNDKLNARAKVLENLVKGLAKFYMGFYDDATNYFRNAAELPGWSDDEGKEVVYMLLGSAELRTYDQYSCDLRKVEQARTAFQRASEINSEYARAYLGLGSATLALANRYDPQQELKLYEAKDWLQTAIEKPDQPESAYIPVKAAYELGQVYLLGSLQGYAGFSKEQAQQYFNRVLENYQSSGAPGELTWYAANAHKFLGRIRGMDKDWTGMIGECRLAINEMDKLNAGSKYIALSIADAYLCVTSAEMGRGYPDLALDAYQQAIKIGGSYASPREREAWEKWYSLLKEGRLQNEKPCP